MDKNYKKVSIIMSIYNETESMIKEAVESILNQTYENFEYIIILDNPERKNIKNLILSYKDYRIRFYENEKNMGLARSLNRAINLSVGDLIARMDADDISLYDRIEKQVNYLDTHSDADLIGTKVSYIDEYGIDINKSNQLICSDKLINRLIKHTNLFNHPTWMFRRCILEKVNGYRAFPSAQDYDFILRTQYYGYKIVNIDDIMLKYRIRNTSITISKSIIQKRMVIYIQSLYRERIKNGTDSFNIKHVEEIINIDKLSKFRYCNDLYFSSKDLVINKHYIRGIIAFIMSLLCSKEQRLFFLNLFKVKLIIYLNT